MTELSINNKKRMKMENLRANGVEVLQTGGGRQGGFWASAVGGGLLGLLGGYLMGGGSANRNAILSGRGYSPIGPVAAPAPFMEFVGHGYHGISRFDLEQSEKIGKLETEIAKRDAVGMSEGYTNHRLHDELAELKHWAKREFITQPTVTVGITGAAFNPQSGTAS